MTVVVRPSKSKSALLAVFGLAALGLAIAFGIDGRLGLLPIAMFLAVVSLPMLYVAAALLVPGWAFLRVDDAGITVKRGRALESYPWSDIESFGITLESRNASAVGLRLRPHHPRHVAAPNAAFHATLGTIWEMGNVELQRLLEERHRRATVPEG